MSRAIFAGGCFWGIEALFRSIPGVTNTRVGYTGGTLENPTYKDVCGGRTGHAEAVEIEFCPRTISYDTLLKIFFENHDPTTLDRQGPDIGHQYRSAIFYDDAEQMAAALDFKENLTQAKKYRTPITTQIVAAQEFYPAEEYHQRYLEKQGLINCHLPKD